jgi:pimeloyl-ACP methyl ester carboxylesterase
MVTYNARDVDGLSVFYREAGDPRLPALVLLHGFPSSSHMFRTLMPALEHRFHLIAPDYPGFGNSEMPDPATFSYTFDHLADITEHLLIALGVTRFGLYMQDYGGPIGHRIIGRHPDWLEWLIVQNANTYEEGFTGVWDGLRHGLWLDRTPETEAPLEGLLAAEGVKQLYLLGHRDSARISPDAWNMDLHFLSRPHSYRVQLDLFYDYRTNVALYPQWQAVLRDRQPAALVIWGRGDIIFTPEGGLAYLRDLPDAEVHLLDSGHFVLEDQVGVVTDLILRFYEQRVAPRLTAPAAVPA